MRNRPRNTGWGESMTAAIDVAIGLILMYLMLSLLCTTINEYIATKLKIRANTLADALQKMLDDPTLREEFYKNGLIVGNKKATATGAQTTLDAVASGAASVRNMVAAPTVTPPAPPAKPDHTQDHPSYLSGRTVALALIGSLDKSKPVPAFGDLKTAVENMPASSIRDALLASLTEAQNDIDKLRTSVATWFDDSMERLSGAYKRKIKWISMLVGLVVAIAFNADSFKVATTLWGDQTLRASIVEVAKKIASDGLPKQANGDVNEAKLKTEIQKTDDTLRGLPIGWTCVPKPAPAPAAGQPPSWWECIKANPPSIAFSQFLGWILTAAALSLGAPFWFDLLNKFVNLRGSGAKPARADGKTS
jgi:hypothetical protein